MQVEHHPMRLPVQVKVCIDLEMPAFTIAKWTPSSSSRATSRARHAEPMRTASWWKRQRVWTLSEVSGVWRVGPGSFAGWPGVRFGGPKTLTWTTSRVARQNRMFRLSFFHRTESVSGARRDRAGSKAGWMPEEG